MLRKRRDASEKDSHQFRIRIEKGSMLWKRRDVPENMFINFEYDAIPKHTLDATVMIVINFEKELNKKHALEEEGCFRGDFHQFGIRIEYE